MELQGYKTLDLFEMVVYDKQPVLVCRDYAKRGKVVTRYTATFHDKDIKDDGTPKKEHWHIVVRLKKRLPIETILDRFGVPFNALSLVKGSEEEAIYYQTHKGCENKAQYDITETSDKEFVAQAIDEEYIQGIKNERAKRNESSTTSDESTEVKQIIDIIDGIGKNDWRKIAITVADAGLWGTFRRGFSIFKLIAEQNAGYLNETYELKFKLLQEKRQKLEELSRDHYGILTKDAEQAIVRWYSASACDLIDSYLTGTASVPVQDDIIENILKEDVSNE